MVSTERNGDKQVPALRSSAAAFAVICDGRATSSPPHARAIVVFDTPCRVNGFKKLTGPCSGPVSRNRVPGFALLAQLTLDRKALTGWDMRSALGIWIRVSARSILGPETR